MRLPCSPYPSYCPLTYGWCTIEVYNQLSARRSAMSVAENKALMRRLYEEVFNQKNLAALDAATAPTFVDHDPDNPTHDLPGARQFFSALFAAFPDLQVTVEDVIA